MKKIIIAAALGLVSTFAQANSTDANSPIYKQFVAMGYSISTADNGSLLVTRKGVEFAVVGTQRYVFLARYFRSKSLDSLSKEDKFEYFSLINSANEELALTYVISDDTIRCGLYVYGEYSPASFGSAISDIEMCNVIFDKYPRILALAGTD